MISSASAIISLIALISYSALFWVTITQNAEGRAYHHFGLYVLTLVLWSFGSFTLYAFPDAQNALFWSRFSFIGSAAMPIAFFEYVEVFLNRNVQRWLLPGLAVFGCIQLANGLGWIVSDARVDGNALIATYAPGVYLVDAAWVFYLGLSIYHLAQRTRKTKDARERTRIRLLFLAIAIIVAGWLSLATGLGVYPINPAINVIAALLAAYALFYEQIHFSALVRKGLNYFVPVLLISVIYFLAIYLVAVFSGRFVELNILNTALIMAVIIILIYSPLQEEIQYWFDRTFYREKFETSQMLHRLEKARNSIPVLDDLAQLTLREVTSTLHLRSACLFLKQIESNEFSLEYAAGLALSNLKLPNQHPVLQYLKGQAPYLTRLELEVNPSFKSLWKQETDALDNIGAEVWIPLRVKGSLAGMFAGGPKSSGSPYTPENLRTLAAVGELIAGAIEIAQLYELGARHRGEAETLQNAISQLTSEIDLEHVLDNILDNLASVIGYDYACIFLTDHDRIVGAAQRGLAHPETVLGQEYKIEADDLFMQVLQARQPFMIADILAYHPYKSFGIPKTVRSWMGIPLISLGKIIGFLSLSSDRPGVYTEKEQAALASTFAGHASIIIENARLFKVEREQRQLAEALREIGVVLSTTLDFDNVLDLLLDQIGRVVPYSIANIFLVENKSMRVARTRYHPGLDPDTAQMLKTSAFSIAPSPNLYYMVDAALPLVISEVPVDASWIESPVPVRSWVGAPVVIKGKVIACFSLAKLEPDFYRNRHAELLEVFAGQAALALQNAQLASEIQKLALRDELTGAFNRSEFLMLGEREFNRAQRYERPLSVIMFDLDHFKRLNEDYGRNIGDQVLRVVSERCRSNIREVDILGRFGGEEFGVILPEAGQLDVQRISERLRRDIAKMPVSTTAGPINVTISIGAASITKEILNFNKLIDCADFAVYQAKRRGRNNVYIYDETSN